LFAELRLTVFGVIAFLLLALRKALYQPVIDSAVVVTAQ
jgi:hypothetical protein